MSSWHSYPSIYNMGHKAIEDLLKGPVNVEEKGDGSQFSFGLFEVAEQEEDGLAPTRGAVELKVRSKGTVMHPDAPMDMFKLGVEHVKSIQHLLHLGWTYRGEYLARPKHNSLAYDRTPRGYIIIFDINTGEEEYLDYDAKRLEADRLGLECVPLLHSGIVENIEQFRKFLTTTSILGGQKIEGVVVKPVRYDLFGRDKKVLFGKFVSEAFKEVHRKAWGENNPTSGDIIESIGRRYGTMARWNKAIQHMREAGRIEDSPRDIGPILQEIWPDIVKEERDAILDELWKWAAPHLKRLVVRGFPEFYKQKLLEKSFEAGPDQGK